MKNNKIYQKLEGIATRLKYAFGWLPIRIQRLGKHFLSFCWSSFHWWLEFFYLLLDVIALPEIYETVIDLIKWSTRGLTQEEINLLVPIFGQSIDYNRVRIDERSFIGPLQKKFCYVSFYTINSWGKMNPSLLIHEMVHIWQFQKMGSIYIPRALAAQRSKEGYNYGGASKITYWAMNNAQLGDFNLEQQADIIADYWRIKNGLAPHWGPAGPADLPYYGFFTQQLLDNTLPPQSSHCPRSF